MLVFHQPYLTGKETENVSQALHSGKWSGDGPFTSQIHGFFENRFPGSKALFTSSCTDALELCALLADLKSGDEVIVPSYTFVSSANAFALRGAKIVFADSLVDNPNIDPEHVLSLITERTKVIVVVHYAGFPCDMESICKVAREKGIIVVEDAALALGACSIDSSGIKKPIGTHADLTVFSFHDTKNFSCGEGGLLLINNPDFVERAEIMREKGTDRSKFFRGQVDKYGWVDLGSSFLGSEISAAVLCAQLEQFDFINNQRLNLWKRYTEAFKVLGEKVSQGRETANWEGNGILYYLVCESPDQRQELIDFLKSVKVPAYFHYQALHRSRFMSNSKTGILPNADRYSDCLLRLPLYTGLSFADQDYIIKHVLQFYQKS